MAGTIDNSANYSAYKSGLSITGQNELQFNVQKLDPIKEELNLAKQDNIKKHRRSKSNIVASSSQGNPTVS